MAQKNWSALAVRQAIDSLDCASAATACAYRPGHPSDVPPYNCESVTEDK